MSLFLQHVAKKTGTREFYLVGTILSAVLKISEIEYFKLAYMQTTLVSHFQCLGPVLSVRFWRKNNLKIVKTILFWKSIVQSRFFARQRKVFVKEEKVFVPNDEYFCDNRRMCAKKFCEFSTSFLD